MTPCNAFILDNQERMNQYLSKLAEIALQSIGSCFFFSRSSLWCGIDHLTILFLLSLPPPARLCSSFDDNDNDVVVVVVEMIESPTIQRESHLTRSRSTRNSSRCQTSRPFTR